MKRVHSFIFIAVLGVTGCAGGPTPIPNSESPAATLYVEKCGTCHAVPHPKRNTISEWQHLVVLMEQRMKERNMAIFSVEERETLLNYLQRHAR